MSVKLSDDIPGILRRFIAYVEDHPSLRTIIGPIILVLPPALMGACGLYPPLQQWIQGHWVILSLCCIWPILLIPASVIYEKYRHRVFLSLEQSSYLITVLSRLVSKKVERFSDHLKMITPKARRVSACDTFKNITQPDDQIKEIVGGIWQYFETMKEDPNVSFRVALARMGENYIIDFKCHHPPGTSVRSPIDKMQTDQCGFSRAKNSKKILVVENQKAEGSRGSAARFIVTREELRDEEGSMICFPIEDPSHKSIPFVVSICADRNDYFKESDAAIYQSILEQFAIRLSLEYCLLELKRKSK